MGEGISAGMESGYCVAQAIANHFDALDMIYADYQRDTQQLKSYMVRQWNFVGRMAGTFSEMIIWTEMKGRGMDKPCPFIPVREYKVLKKFLKAKRN